MKFIVFEIQTYADGTVGTLVNTADTYNEAKSIYHTKLAAAAISSVPIHSVVIMTADGVTSDQESYRHEVVEEVTDDGE